MMGGWQLDGKDGCYADDQGRLSRWLSRVVSAKATSARRLFSLTDATIT